MSKSKNKSNGNVIPIVTPGTQAAADEDKKKKATAPVKPTATYFKSKVGGLGFQVSESDPKNPVAPEIVRFVPYYEKYQGDRITVGYLKVENSSTELLERVEADANTEKISKKEFDEATGDNAERATY